MSWIQISSGRGPHECELAVSLFLKSFQRECSEKNIEIKLIDAVCGNIDGNFKSVLLSSQSKDSKNILAEQFFQSINGTILWICKSPYRPEHKRKNWFINVEVIRLSQKLSFNESEVEFKAMRSSGPGGQNVNKVETAVRAIHIPTGLIGAASEERSQMMNKKLALSRLEKLIKEKNDDSASQDKKAMWRKHNTLERGNAVRIYEGKKFKLKK